MPAINPSYAKQPGGGGASFPEGGAPGDVLIFVGPDDEVAWGDSGQFNAAIGCVFDAATDPLAVLRFVDAPVPYNCTIVQWEAYGEPSGTLTVEVWRDVYANYPPTVADKISGSTGISVSGVKSKDTVLTGWTTTLLEGDILRFIITATTNFSKITIALKVLKT